MTGTLIQFLLFLAVTGLALYGFGRVVYHRYLYIQLGKSVDLKKEAKLQAQGICGSSVWPDEVIEG